MSVDPGLASWLQLTLTPGIGGATLRTMLRQFGLPENIVGQSPSELSKFVAREALDGMASAQVQKAVASALEWAAHAHHSVITLADPSYPRALLAGLGGDEALGNQRGVADQQQRRRQHELHPDSGRSHERDVSDQQGDEQDAR